MKQETSHPSAGKSQTQKVIDKHLEDCFSTHKEKIPICYLPYIHKIVNELSQTNNPLRGETTK